MWLCGFKIRACVKNRGLCYCVRIRVCMLGMYVYHHLFPSSLFHSEKCLYSSSLKLLSLLENMNDSEREKAIILLWNGNSPTSEHKELVSALGNDPILVRAQVFCPVILFLSCPTFSSAAFLRLVVLKLCCDMCLPGISSLLLSWTHCGDCFSAASPFVPQMQEKGILVVTGRETPYPQLSGPLKQNFGDSMQRIMWRSKQALDFASVMEYAVELQKDFSNPIPFYLQLEDDIIASPGFVTRILNRVHEYEGSGTSWSMLSFYCPHPIADGHRLEAGQFYGFIGQVCAIPVLMKAHLFFPWVLTCTPPSWPLKQLFRMTDLPSIANYFTVNFDDRPVDWLMKDYIVVCVFRGDWLDFTVGCVCRGGG